MREREREREREIERENEIEKRAREDRAVTVAAENREKGGRGERCAPPIWAREAGSRDSHQPMSVEYVGESRDGWEPMGMRARRERGLKGVGVTVSPLGELTAHAPSVSQPKF